MSKEMANNILFFLNKVTIQAAEVRAYVECRDFLEKVLTDEHPPVDPDKPF